LTRETARVEAFSAGVFAVAIAGGPYWTPGRFRTAVIVYDDSYLGVALFFNQPWRYAASRDGHLPASDVDRASAAKITEQYYGPVTYMAGVALAQVSIPASP